MTNENYIIRVLREGILGGAMDSHAYACVCVYICLLKASTLVADVVTTFCVIQKSFPYDAIKIFFFPRTQYTV